MDTWVVVVVAAIGSSALTAVVQVFVAPWRLREEHKWLVKAKREEQILDAERRQEVAHEAAREEYVPIAAEVFRWTDEVCWAYLGPEVGIFDPEGSSSDPETRVGAALSDLRRVWSEHPTAKVRQTAKALSEDLTSFYGEPPLNRDFPSYEDRDALLRHRSQAEQLLADLHGPAR